VVCDATLRLERTSWVGMIWGQREAWDIAIDGAVVGAISDQETVEVSVEPGHHRLRLGHGRHVSRQRTFDVGEGQVMGFRCHAPVIWPVWLAAQFKSDLWIALRQT